jgi:hypothetical protein
VKNFTKVTCADGFSLSIQASSFHYCSPRADRGPWTAVEIGFPTSKDPFLEKFAEDPSAPIEKGADGTMSVQTVYGWVPATVVKALLEKHGGVATGECPALDIRFWEEGR